MGYWSWLWQAKGQFKRRSIANNVEIFIPVPADADSPRFRVSDTVLVIWPLITASSHSLLLDTPSMFLRRTDCSGPSKISL